MYYLLKIINKSFKIIIYIKNNLCFFNSASASLYYTLYIYKKYI